MFTKPFSDPPFFWSSHYDKSVNYCGHAEGFDPPQIEGSVNREDATVLYKKGGKLLAVATVGRDLENLKAARAQRRSSCGSRLRIRIERWNIR